jgi:hypothetical protein
MMRPVFITTLVIIASGIVKVYDLVVAQTSGGPGNASEVPAKYVYDYMFQAQNLGQGFAASTMMLLTVAIVIVPWAYLEFGGRSVANICHPHHGGRYPDAVSASRKRSARAQGPARTFSGRNIFLYGTLFVAALYYLLPLYVMVVTSLKGMPEIRIGNIFSPPVEITFEPWVKAWAQACTGLNCDGLSRGFWNSVRITDTIRRPVDRARLRQRLCARQLALQGRRHLLHHPDRRRLHTLPGDDLSDRHHAPGTRPLSGR